MEDNEDKSYPQFMTNDKDTQTESSTRILCIKRMGYIGALSSLCVGFGVPVVALLGLTWNSPVLSVLVLISSFFWLLSAITSSFLWLILIPFRDELLFTLFYCVLIQELFRYFFYRIFKFESSSFICFCCSNIIHRAIERGFARSRVPFIDTSHGITAPAAAGGLGFGLCASLISQGSYILTDSSPGTFFSKSCSVLPFFYLMSLYSSLFVGLNVFISISSFKAYEKGNKIDIFICCVSHVCATSLLVLNHMDNGCAISLPLLVVIVSLTGLMSLFTRSSSYAPGIVVPDTVDE